ncbi:K14 protein, putative [Trichomonas vaginalis G3]|uniref:K14 protein, putative n=1 Tax=Trichomonas vaginalis (strain ATCC PRA-98 / G3) TaxID=412133 RepID=A2DKR9_TRIV3|nr:spectrin binding [Trichomonas vaginalis G3]EAY19052.1 K14 protein, putative [Trichomonas vaginalis G3]KAI5521143.1 spectrin binding [Trichomonas vaginalis G3]|eukprot:XP_001580038.1 K14 protein [Trichomonas vaginalis G3]
MSLSEYKKQLKDCLFENDFKTLESLMCTQKSEEVKDLIDLFNTPSQFSLFTNNKYKELPTEGLSLVHIACYLDSVECLDSLKKIYKENLSNITTAKNTNKPGITGTYKPIHYAVLGGSVECVYYLLNEGIDLNEVIKDTRSPLYIAIVNNDLEMVETLIDNGAEIPPYQPQNIFDPIKTATLSGNFKLLEYLLNNYQQTEGILTSVVTLAVQLNLTTAIRGLIECGSFDPNYENPNVEGPLIAAIKNKNLEVIKILLEKGVDVNIPFGYERIHPIHCAVLFKDIEIIDYLLSHSADPNAADLYKNTPIFYALKLGIEQNKNNGKIDFPIIERIIEILINYGADINLGRESKQTPLQFALDSPELCQKDFINFLIQNKADPDAPYYVVDVNDPQKSGSKYSIKNSILYNMIQVPNEISNIFNPNKKEENENKLEKEKGNKFVKDFKDLFKNLKEKSEKQKQDKPEKKGILGSQSGGMPSKIMQLSSKFKEKPLQTNQSVQLKPLNIHTNNNNNGLIRQISTPPNIDALQGQQLLNKIQRQGTKIERLGSKSNPVQFINDQFGLQSNQPQQNGHYTLGQPLKAMQDKGINGSQLNPQNSLFLMNQQQRLHYMANPQNIQSYQNNNGLQMRQFNQGLQMSQPTQSLQTIQQQRLQPKQPTQGLQINQSPRGLQMIQQQRMQMGQLNQGLQMRQPTQNLQMSQPNQSLQIGQPNQGLQMSQPNQGLLQMIQQQRMQMGQPNQGLLQMIQQQRMQMGQPNQGLLQMIQQQRMQMSQPNQGLQVSQPTQNLQMSQPNQGLQVSQPTQSLQLNQIRDQILGQSQQHNQNIPQMFQQGFLQQRQQNQSQFEPQYKQQQVIYYQMMQQK